MSPLSGLQEICLCFVLCRRTAFKTNQNYMSDREINAISLCAKRLKVSLVYLVETNGQFPHSENPRKLQFAVSSQPVITRRTISSHLQGTHLLILSLRELPGKPWPNYAQLQAGSNGQTVPGCKQAAMPSFAPSTQIKGLNFSFPLPLGNTQSCNHTGLKPVVGNQRLDANHLHFYTSLFGQGCPCLSTLLDGCCLAAGTASFPNSLSTKKTYGSNRCEVMASPSCTMVLQTICPQIPVPWQSGGRGTAAMPQEGSAGRQCILLTAGNLQGHFCSLLSLLSRGMVWDKSKGSSQFKSRAKMPDFFSPKKNLEQRKLQRNHDKGPKGCVCSSWERRSWRGRKKKIITSSSL